MRKLTAMFEVLRTGRALSDPEKWRKRQVTVTALTTFLWALVQLGQQLGWNIPVDQAAVDAVAVLILGVVGVYIAVSTDEKLGLPAKRQQSPSGETDEHSL